MKLISHESLKVVPGLLGDFNRFLERLREGDNPRIIEINNLSLGVTSRYEHWLHVSESGDGCRELHWKVYRV